MRQYFLTREKAEKNLETRQTLARIRIEKDNDVILTDNSFVYPSYKRNYKRPWDKRIVWYNSLVIWTQQMLIDIQKIDNEKK